MDAQTNDRWISPTMRCAIGSLGLLIGVLLVVAMRLTPDERGLGTHEQLGLSACWIHQQTGVPCPSCGMTTAWAYSLQGEFSAAAQANFGGLLLCLAGIAAAPWLLISAGRGRWLISAPKPQAILWGATWILVVTLLDWARRALLG